MCLNSYKQFIRVLFLEGIASIKPERLINSALNLHNNNVIINSKAYDLSKGKCYVIGFGKAVTDMSLQTSKILQNKFYKGILSVPQGFNVNKNEMGSFKIFYGAFNNIPDENSLKATDEIIALVEEATKDDLILVMISGGGSALLSKPKYGITLQEKVELIKHLANSGANIKELNCVRKRISAVKGGKLAKYIYPARSVSFILSDIVGDPLDLVASGPTIKNEEPLSKALDILKKYNLYDNNSNIIKTIKEDDDVNGDIFDKFDNIILGNNGVALNAIKKRATEEGYETVILSRHIEMNVDELSQIYAQLAHSVINESYSGPDEKILGVNKILSKLIVNYENKLELEHIIRKGSKKVCLLLGGETVVSVRGTGKGGRNQELVLRFSTCFDSLLLKKLPETKVIFLSGGTDGIDGPTDSAGALTYPGQSLRAMKQDLAPNDYLIRNDSYNYFNRLDDSEDSIKIGHSGVNVMDLHIFLFHL